MRGRLRDCHLLYNGSMHDDPVNVSRSVKQKKSNARSEIAGNEDNLEEDARV